MLGFQNVMLHMKNGSMTLRNQEVVFFYYYYFFNNIFGSEWWSY
jgi:hypothetical protein